MEQLELFKNETKAFSVDCVDCFEKDNTLYFRLSDIAEILEVGKNTASMWKSWADEEEIEFKNNELGGYPIPYASESLLYRILNRSNSPKAKPFERWVTKTVIPSIRKNGGYIHHQEELSPEQIVANALVVAQKIIDNQKKQLELAESALKRIEQAPGCFSIAQTAKALKLPYGRNTLFDKLRDLGLLNSYNEPYQEQINANHFKVVNKICGDGKNHIVPLVTGRGLVYLAKKFNASIDENIKADC